MNTDRPSHPTKTPLRLSVEWLTTLAVPWTLAELEKLAHENTPSACRCYVGLLLSQRVLTATAGAYTRGPMHAQWIATVPRTRPGGRARAYLRRKEAREALMVRDWKHRITPTPAAPVIAVARDRYLSGEQAALIIGISVRTLRNNSDRWGITAYLAKSSAVGRRGYLYLESDVRNFVRGGLAQMAGA